MDYLSMPIDNQLRRATNNSNQLHHFNSLKTNPAYLNTCFILEFLNFYMITVCLILLIYFSVYLILTQVRDYGLNINKFNIANGVLIKCFYFCCYAVNLKRMLLLESDDIETNPGPRRSSYIKFCHWNLNGLAVHVIEAFITTRNLCIIFLLETFLDSSIDISDTRININDYSLLRADHPSNTKHGGVYMHYKIIYPLSGELTYLIFKNV